MYSYFKGELVEKNEDSIVIETGQIGYLIYVPGQVLDYLPSIGETIKIYTYLHVREDAMILYGFLTKDDLKVFKLLLGVSGIGPKGALSILSVMTTDDLRFAVLGDDAKTIAKAPGVGAKTAARLILELKDKLSLQDALDQTLEKNQDLTFNESNLVKKEAIQALVALGYSSTEATKVLSSIEIGENTTVEDLLKLALKQMAFM